MKWFANIGAEDLTGDFVAMVAGFMVAQLLTLL